MVEFSGEFDEVREVEPTPKKSLRVREYEELAGADVPRNTPRSSNGLGDVLEENPAALELEPLPYQRPLSPEERLAPEFSFNLHEPFGGSREILEETDSVQEWDPTSQPLIQPSPSSPDTSHDPLANLTSPTTDPRMAERGRLFCESSSFITQALNGFFKDEMPPNGGLSLKETEIEHFLFYHLIGGKLFETNPAAFTNEVSEGAALPARELQPEDFRHTGDTLLRMLDIQSDSPAKTIALGKVAHHAISRLLKNDLFAEERLEHRENLRSYLRHTSASDISNAIDALFDTSLGTVPAIYKTLDAYTSEGKGRELDRDATFKDKAAALSKPSREGDAEVFHEMGTSLLTAVRVKSDSPENTIALGRVLHHAVRRLLDLDLATVPVA